jgi:hypothetical protein
MWRILKGFQRPYEVGVAKRPDPIPAIEAPESTMVFLTPAPD